MKPAILALAALVGASIVPAATVRATAAPDAGGGPAPWVRHVERHHGQLADTLADVLTPDPARPASAAAGSAQAQTAPAHTGRNRQVNIDSDPPVRQSNPAVAANPRLPNHAVGVFLDSAGPSYQIVRTTDAGRHWSAQRLSPQLSDGQPCSPRIPSIAYSIRDRAFYLGVSCATRDGASVVKLWRSSDDGVTWTAPAFAATVATNVDASGAPDPSLFFDWPRVAVDNDPRSPQFGRIYVSMSKFHILDSGESDYCPLQVRWTDGLPALPRDASFTTVQVGPDGGTPHGVGLFTAGWTRIAVGPRGTVVALYAQEGCNTGFDTHLQVVRSTDGGRHFSAPVQVDAPGQFADNPDPDDLLPDQPASLGISPSLTVSPTTGTFVAAYQNNVTAARSGADVWVSTSRDRGKSWTGQPLATGANGKAARHDQFFSSVTSDERGRFYALWLDTRLDPAKHLISTFEATSRNDARSWSQRRISTKPFDPDNTTATGSSLGVTAAIAASRTAVYPLWPDARDNAYSTTGIGDLDIWTNVERVR